MYDTQEPNIRKEGIKESKDMKYMGESTRNTNNFAADFLVRKWSLAHSREWYMYLSCCLWYQSSYSIITLWYLAIAIFAIASICYMDISLTRHSYMYSMGMVISAWLAFVACI